MFRFLQINLALQIVIFCFLLYIAFLLYKFSKIVFSDDIETLEKYYFTMKKFLKFKWVYSNFLIRWIIVCIAHLYIRFVYATSKIIIRGDFAEISEYLSNKIGVVLFSWHGTILLAPMIVPHTFSKYKNKISVLSSANADGKIAGNLSRTFKIKDIEGYNVKSKQIFDKRVSSFRINDFHHKFGKNIVTMKNILKVLKNGEMFMLAADAPKGPAYHFNTSIIDVVRKTNSKLAFGLISSKRKITLKSWDNFEIHLPFNKILVEYRIISKDILENEKTEKKSANIINNVKKRNDEEIKK
ncbi:MAG: lysophospholipid acyltransferase family protein [Rickettsiales bacterium]|nr:MAG: lysophospholipid acyltransferase family protein [Rickettsiales bacterium]